MKQLFGLLVIVLVLGLGYWFTKKSAPLFSRSKPLSDDVAQKRLSSKIKVLQKFLNKNEICFLNKEYSLFYILFEQVNEFLFISVIFEVNVFEGFLF